MRLFIAMPLPVEIEKMLGEIVFALKQNRAKVKWVDSKNIHLTLKFLGETDEKLVPGIIEAIKHAVEKYRAVVSQINGLGAFPNPKRPRVIWAGLAGGIENLAEIAGYIEDEMEKLGFEKENRPFKSHLTLGRVKDNFRIEELTERIKNHNLSPTELVFDKIVLFKSTLRPEGPIYERLFETELQE